MRTRPRLTLHTLPSVIALLAAHGVLTGCDRAAPRCSIARGEFAALYKLKSGTGPCAELRGEVLGVQAYNAPRSGSDSRPDYNRTSVGIQASTITSLLASAEAAGVSASEGDLPYNLGAFRAARPDDDDLCVVPTLSVAQLRLPEVPEQVEACTTTPAQPAVDVRYAFSNVRVLASAGAYGTQFSADLTYTRDGCTAEYTVWAVYPSVPCGAEPPSMDAGLEPPPADDAEDGGADAGTDDAALPAVDPETGEACPEPEPPAPPEVPDMSACAAAPDPANGRPVGSGINADFAVVCDPDLFLCVPSKEPPSLR